MRRYCRIFTRYKYSVYINHLTPNCLSVSRWLKVNYEVWLVPVLLRIIRSYYVYKCHKSASRDWEGDRQALEEYLLNFWNYCWDTIFCALQVCTIRLTYNSMKQKLVVWLVNTSFIMHRRVQSNPWPRVLSLPCRPGFKHCGFPVKIALWSSKAKKKKNKQWRKSLRQGVNSKRHPELIWLSVHGSSSIILKWSF